MEEVVNLGIPHVGEKIFESLETSELIKCLDVSRSWKVLAENVLIKRWKGERKKSKMLEACRSGETKVVQHLLECCNPEEIGLNNEGYKDVVQFLLNHSERIVLNARDNHGRTAFILACSKGRKDVVKLLLDHSERIELNARDDFGRTAYMMACSKGHKDVVKLLLNHSERMVLNARDDRNKTAYIIACNNGRKDAQFLLEHSEDCKS